MAPDVRIIGPQGEDLGIMQMETAVRLAEEMAVDLACLHPRAQPPVYQLIEFGRLKFEAAQKVRAGRHQDQRVTVKEVRLRPVTDERDSALKAESVPLPARTSHRQSCRRVSRP